MVKGGVKQFDIIVDPALDCVHLLVTTTCQQWRILVEQRSTGYVWGCGDIGHVTRDVSDTCDTEDTSAVQRTRLQSIKQMSVDRIANLRNRLAEGRRLLKSRSEADETLGMFHAKIECVTQDVENNKLSVHKDIRNQQRYFLAGIYHKNI